MKIIKILWTWCPNCLRLEKNIKLALEKAKILANVEKVTDIETIMSYNIMSMPGIVINWKLVSSWKVLEVDEIIDLLDSNCCGWTWDCCGWGCDEDEDEECCSDNACVEVEEEKKSRWWCCCGWRDC